MTNQDLSFARRRYLNKFGTPPPVLMMYHIALERQIELLNKAVLEDNPEFTMEELECPEAYEEGTMIW